MKRRPWLIVAVLLLVWASWSSLVLAHRDPSHNYFWPAYRPVADHELSCMPDPTRDMTLLMRPVRVDLDTEAPGRYGVRSVRLYLRSLTCGDEASVAFERSLFFSDQEMKAFAKRLATFSSSPILSLRFRGLADSDSPSYARRYKAVALPYWVETPCY